MSSIFEEYDIILNSGLFDPDFYIESYPDVAALGTDPLLHYIEYGARELRNPSRAFNARIYALHCRAEGREPANPLLHFIVSGSPPSKLAQENRDPSGRLKFYIDLPPLVDGVVEQPVRGNLEIAGWALAHNGIDRIEISIDGQPIANAFLGVRRPDVKAQFPDWPEAITAGFTAVIPQRSLKHGKQRISVTLHDTASRSQSIDFVADVPYVGEPDGPWSLDHRGFGTPSKMWADILVEAKWQPTFNIALSLPSPDAIALERAAITLASIASQSYARYRIFVDAPEGMQSDRLIGDIARDFPSLQGRLAVVTGKAVPQPQKASSDTGASVYYMALVAGDCLGPDALLEFAVAAGENRNADFLYGDDRRYNPATGVTEAFFKPDWSPDLLLSTDYVGRAWCARGDLLERGAIDWSNLTSDASYGLTLRLTELASVIRHLPVVVMEFQNLGVNPEGERQELERALERRKIVGSVEAGPVAAIFRVRRTPLSQARVSIIIPTCAARGLIKTCIETIKRHTSHRSFEIICVENIPDDLPEWRAWLTQNADKVIRTAAPFNWSRFNNLGATAASGDILLFLNDDIEITDADWLDGLLEHAQRPEIGVVGAKLLYPDKRIQHAGMFLASSGVGRHAFRYLHEDELGYFGLAQTQRNVIAVTGACLMTRRDTFEALGGFDETHAVVNNDLDYCLRAWEAGLGTLYTPYVTLIHHEQASRTAIGDVYDSDAFDSRWYDLFARGDPFYNPNLSRERDDYAYEWESIEHTRLGEPETDRASIRSILAIKLDHIGDCVLAFPALRRLKQHFPRARIYVLSSRASRSIWELEPAVDEVIEFDFFYARSSLGAIDLTEEQLTKLEQRLAPHAFDLAVDLRKHMETRPLLRRTGARMLCGFDHRGKYSWLNVALEWSEDIAGFRKRQHASDDLVNLVDAIAAALTRSPRSIVARGGRPLSIDPHLFERPVVCVHSSAGNPVKQWPISYFTALIDLLTERDGVHVALIGSPDEIEEINEIAKAVRRKQAVWSLAGVLSLEKLPDFLAECALFVGNDSGPKHIAASLGIPTVGIHSGIVDVREWGPVGPLAVGVSRNVHCSPCYRSKVQDCHRQLACLTGISPGEIYRLCSRMLALAPTRMPLEP